MTKNANGAMPGNRSHPAVWVPTLYFAEGVPFFAVNLMALVFYQRVGLSNKMTAMITGLLALPWGLKFLWSPLLEMYRTKNFFVLSMEFLAGISLGFLAISLHYPAYLRYSIVFFYLAAFCSSTHDIAADGLYIASLVPHQQAAYAGWQGGLYNTARFFVQGGLIILAGFLEMRMPAAKAWSIAFALCGAVMVTLSWYHLGVLPKEHALNRGKTFREASETFKDVVVSFFRKPNIWLLLGFVLLCRVGEGQILKIGPLFLKASRETGGLGLSTAQFGAIYGTLGTGAFVLGTLAGGHFISKLGLKRALTPLIFVLNLPILVYVYLSSALPMLRETPNTLALLLSPVSIAMMLEMFAYGFGFVGVIVLMMQQIAPGKYQTAHYAFASSLMNLGAVLPGTTSGFIQARVGYRNFFVWAFLCGIPAIAFSRFIPMSNESARANAEGQADPAEALIPWTELER